MHQRMRLLAVLTVLALLTAACGGDSNPDDQSGDPTGSTEQDDGSNNPGEGAGGDDSGGGSDDTSGSDDGGDAPEIDPGSMPAPGEVVFEIGGQTFTFNADEMDYFICEIGDDFVNVRSESGTQDLAVQFDPTAGLGNANLTPEGSGVRYDSFFGPATTGGAAAEEPYVLYEGRFDATQLDNISEFSDVGTGRVSVSCP
ncbi:MAG: hypothetical protein OEM39_07980 [Acidimicrobiia bacterium]|nr:hypothetical protein [Acidimicrobiia bacterium]